MSYEEQRKVFQERVAYWENREQADAANFQPGNTGVPTIDVPPELLDANSHPAQPQEVAERPIGTIGLKKKPVSFEEDIKQEIAQAEQEYEERMEQEKSAKMFDPASKPVIKTEMPDFSKEEQKRMEPVMDSGVPVGPKSASVISPGTGRRSALIKLPSRGIYYDPNRIEIVNGCIRSFMFSGREELGFAGSTGDYLKVIDAILGSCLNSDTIAQELIVGDRLYALIAIRAHTYGSNYRYQVRCSSCNKPFQHEVDLLKDLPVEYAEDDWGEEPFQIQLPISGDIVSWRMMRGFDELKVNEYADNYNDKHARNRDILSNPQEECRNALVIVDINGHQTTDRESFKKKIEWLKNLDGQDMSYLRTAINAREPGLKMTTRVECPSCGNKWEAMVRLTAEFFRPQFKVHFRHTKNRNATR